MTGRWAIVSNHSPVARGRMCPWEPLGASGVIFTQCLNLEIILPLKDSLCLPPDVPQTSSSLLAVLVWGVYSQVRAGLF